MIQNPRKVWVNRACTVTADDITRREDCWRLLCRARRAIRDLLAQGADRPGAPRRLRDALKYKHLAEDALQARLDQLPVSQPE